MKVTYDPQADAAYIYLQKPGAKVSNTYPCDPLEVNGQINIDFDSEGKIVGVEVLDAKRFLDKAVLDMGVRAGQV